MARWWGIVVWLWPVSVWSAPGAWLQPTGHGLGLLNSTYYSTDRYFDESGQRHAQPSFDKFELNPYVEYGLSDDWTVGGNAFVHYLKQEQRQNFGLGEVELFGRRNLYRHGNFAAAIQPLVKTPSIYANTGLPRSGSKDWDAEAMLYGGYGFELWQRHHFAEIGVGYRHRFGERADQYKLVGKLGIAPAENWLIVPAFYLTQATELQLREPFQERGSNDYDLSKLELTALYELGNDWFTGLTVFRHIGGQNTGEGGGGSFILGRAF